MTVIGYNTQLAKNRRITISMNNYVYRYTFMGQILTNQIPILAIFGPGCVSKHFKGQNGDVWRDGKALWTPSFTTNCV